MDFVAADFGKPFTWGVAASAYQTEGAYLSDGKGRSIWDVFTSQKGKIPGGESGRTACDFYNRYIQDLILMKSLNIPAFRFSISWSRLMPDGIGKPNAAGIEYYNQLIDFCLELGIEPWITLYHWDLPQSLQDMGGWANRNIVYWFGDYVRLCAECLGDRVKNWIVLNEPLVFTGAGYFLGLHAPGLRDFSGFLAAAHHAALCQAEGGRILRSMRGDLKIGTTFSCTQVDAFSEREEDEQAAFRVDALLNRLFVEPLLGMGYPLQDLKFLRQIERFILPQDESRMAFDMDFIGIQNYTREVVRHSYTKPLIHAQAVSADKRMVETTLMNWEVYPPALYNMLQRFGAYPMIKEIIVSENGAAFPDVSEAGGIHDIKRIDFLQKYLRQVLQAKMEGVPVSGYFVWSFTDNFEWAEGFRPTFGLVHVDYRTQRRTVKDSGFWYRNFLRSSLGSCPHEPTAVHANMQVREDTNLGG